MQFVGKIFPVFFNAAFKMSCKTFKLIILFLYFLFYFFTGRYIFCNG